MVVANGGAPNNDFDIDHTSLIAGYLKLSYIGDLDDL